MALSVKINGQAITGETLADLQRAVRAFLDGGNPTGERLGMSQCRGHGIYGWKISGGDRAMDMSYNGRVWEGGSRKIPWTPGCRAEIDVATGKMVLA